MELLIHTLLPSLLLMSFGALVMLWTLYYRRPDHELERAASSTGWIALGLYTVWILLITLTQKQVPILTVGQLSAFLGFLVWADQTVVHHRISQRVLVLLPLATVVLLLIGALLAGVEPSTPSEKLRGGWAAFHITLSLAGVAMLIGGGVFGAGALMLHRQLLGKRFGRLFASFPSLGELQRLRALTSYAGWLCITVSLGSSIIFMAIEREGTPSSFSHLHGMLALWLIVSVLIISERFRWLNPHRQARLSVALSVVILALLMVSVLSMFGVSTS